MRVGPLKRLSGRLAVGALLIGVLPLLSPPPALAAPAAPSDLSPDGTVVSGAPVLSWSRVKGAVEYDVQIATSPDFSPALYDETTENSQATPIANLPTGGDLYWRVRAVSSSHVRGSWGNASFAHEVDAGPQLLTPAPGAQLQEPQDSPLLTWEPVNRATSYTVEIDTDDQFIDATTKPVKGNGYTFPTAIVQQTYYWHVKANFNGGLSSEWSEVRTLEVLPLPAPDLTYPDDSSTTQIQDTVLDWEPVAGAVEYQLQVDTDDQFNDPVIDEDRIVATRYAPPATIDNDQYWWRVRAIDAGGTRSPWTTSLNQFQRSWPDQPALVFPADGEIVSTPLFYEWDGVPHASSYKLEVGDDSSFSPGHFDTCTTTNTTYTPGRLSGDCAASSGTTYWRVLPLDGLATPAINGVYSEIHSFTYAPGNVTQLGPADGSTVDVPTLTWAAYPAAQTYTVTLKKTDGSNVATVTTESTSWTPTGNSRLDPTDAPFHWTVRANRADGSATSVPLFGFDWTFNVNTDVPDDAGIDGLTPTSSPTTHDVRPPTLTWEPWFDSLTSTPAAYYRVYYAKVGNPNVSQLGGSLNYPYSAGSDDTVVAPGDYYWFARAFDSHGVLLGTGPNGGFTIDPLNTVSSRRLSLTGVGLQSTDTTCARDLPANPGTGDVCSNLQQTPVLKWDPVPGAAYYMIYMGRDRELTNMVYSPTLTGQKTVNTMWNPTDELADSQAGTAYYWFIRPCNAEGICAAAPTKANNAFDKRSNAVGGLTESEHDSPSALPATGPGGASDPPEFADEVVLSWDDYLLTNQAGNANDVTGLAAQVEAKSYKVEISSDPNFSSGFILRSGQIDQTTYAPYLTTLPEGPLYWRVQAIDGSGNSLPWSTGRSLPGSTAGIEKKSPVPVLNAPSDGQSVSASPAFSWDALPYAADYDIQVARNGDTTFSTGNIAAASNGLAQTTFVPNLALPAAGNPYVWRIRRGDADNRAGAWSQPETFTVSAEAPSQLLPNDNAFVPSKDAFFTWLSVDGAASYRFERRTQGATSSQETKTTTGLSWASQKHIPDGSYEWRVSSFDASNNLMGASAWRPFRVDGTAPTVIRKAPIEIGFPNTGIKVDFSERVSGVTSSSLKIFLKGSAAAVPSTVKSVNNHKSATLDPKKNLKVGKTYTIKLLPGIKDAAGHPLKPVTWTITIESA
ncbi:MAG TPA: Ig-like domain-containing protein [Nocardioidaceae bacterium]|nr:Ig-like domain-containing protein [Nocardioidaceae bacterium]